MTNITFIRDGQLQKLKEAQALMAQLQDAIPEKPLREEFRAALASPFRMAEFLSTKREDVLARIPPQYHFLFTKLASFEQETLELFDYTEETAASNGLELGVTAASRIVLDRITPDELDDFDTLGIGDDEVLIRLAFQGKAALSAQVDAATGVLATGITIDAATDQCLAYSLRQDKSDYPVSFLPAFSQSVVDPLELATLTTAMNGAALVRFERTGLGSALVGVEVGIAQELQGFLGYGPASGKAGMTFTVEYRDKSSFDLALQRLGDGSFVLELNKTRSAARSSQLELGLDVSLKGFRKGLLEDVTKALPRDPGLERTLDKLDEIMSEASAGAIRTELATQLAQNWRQGAKVFGPLLGEDDVEELAPAIRNELCEAIEELLNTKVDLWNTEAERAAAIVSARIADSLGIGGDHRLKLDQYLGSAITKALEAGRAEIDAGIKKLVSANAVADLLTPLAPIDAQVDKAIAAFVKSADKGFAAVKAALQRLYARYTQLRQKLIETITDDLEERVAIEFLSFKNRSETRVTALKVRFAHVSEPLERLYRALWTSDLRDLPRLLANLAADGTQRIEVSGEYRTLLAETSGSQLSINFLGMKFSARELFSSEVEVALAPDGRLLVARSRAEILEQRSRFRESQSITVRANLDLLRRTAPLTPPVTLKLLVMDARFKPGAEVSEFFRALEHGQLVRSGMSDDVSQTLFPLSGNSKPVRDAELALNVVFTWTDWLRMMGRDLQGADVAEAWQPADICKQFIACAREMNPRCHADALELMERCGGETLPGFLLALGKLNPSRAKSFVGDNPRHASSAEFATSYQLARAMSGLHVGLVAMQDTWTLITALLRLPALNEMQMEEFREQLTRLNRDFSRAFGSMLKTGHLFDDPGKVNWLTLAALRFLMANSRSANDYLSCTFDSPRTGTIVFS